MSCLTGCNALAQDVTICSNLHGSCKRFNASSGIPDEERVIALLYGNMASMTRSQHT